MLIGEGITRIQSLYSKGMPSDDSRLSNRHIYSKLRSARIRAITQKLDKKQIVSNWCYQPVTITMIEAPKTECAEISSATCKVLRSKTLIPQIFTNLSRLQIQSVTSLDGENNYTETQWDIIKYKSARKYTANISEYYIRNGYLYITDKKVLEKVSVTALYNDPIEARHYSNACGGISTACENYLEFDFAIDGKLEELILEFAKEEFVLFLNLNDDRKNNAVDDTGRAPKEFNANINRNNTGDE